MLVIDASAIVELLLLSPRGVRVRQRIVHEILHAPHLIYVEVAHSLRRLLLNGAITRKRAEEALNDLMSARFTLHEHRNLLPDIWRLRDSISAYDAAYVSLAEALRVPLITCDNKLARAHGHTAVVELI